jgi:hypothetical protein
MGGQVHVTTAGLTVAPCFAPARWPVASAIGLQHGQALAADKYLVGRDRLMNRGLFQFDPVCS